MSDNILDKLEKQEKELRFESVSFSLLHEIGESILKRAREMGGSVYVMIRVAGDVVYASAMDGTTGNNVQWARRKANTSELAGKRLLCRQLVLNIEYDTENLDTSEEIPIGDVVGHYTEKEGVRSIYWVLGDYLFSVSGNLEREEIVKVAEGIQLP